MTSGFGDPRGPKLLLVRVYGAPRREVGDYRVLVDGLWPRGISKVELDCDEWLKALAPSAELRKWYSYRLDRFETFAQRYRQELQKPAKRAILSGLLQRAGSSRIVLMTATRDVEHSSAAVMISEIEGYQGRQLNH